MDLKSLLKTNQKYLTILSSNWIKTPKDFFQYWPRTYEDRTKIKNLNEILLDWTIQVVKWKITEKKVINLPTWKKLIEFRFEDEKWNKWIAQFWNSKYILQQIKTWKTYIFIWKPKLQYWKIIFNTPEFVETGDFESAQNQLAVWRIYPIYTELGWIKSSWFAKKIWENLDKIPLFFKEYYPDQFLKQFNLIGITDMVKNLHFPDSHKTLKQARYRLWFDKLLRIQLVSLMNRIEYSEEHLKNSWRKDENKISQTIWKSITDNISEKIYKIIWIAQKIYNEYWCCLREMFYQKKLINELENNNFKI